MELWKVEAPYQIRASSQFLSTLFDAASCGTVLAGFDFPIGVPESYGILTGVADFRSALVEFGTGRWSRFYEVAEIPTEISIERPFYPLRSSASGRQAHLIASHGVKSIDNLRRRCERATANRRAACPLFWTLGGNQVGKAAIAGWREVVGPARQQGAKLWPFDGVLQELANDGGVVIAETYPAEAYGHIGVRFRQAESKRRRRDRAAKAGAINDWADRSPVYLHPDVVSAINDGFGGDAVAEDRFDAVLGLLAMIEVVSGRRPAGSPEEPAVRRWEGWILGQAQN